MAKLLIGIVVLSYCWVCITVDPHDRIWVTSINGRIQQFGTNGKLLGGLQSSQGAEPGRFSAPHTIAFNSRGEFFVVDSFNHRIQKFAIVP